MKKVPVLISFILLIFACNQKRKENADPQQVKITPSKGVWQNPDSFARPVTITAGIPQTVAAGKPNVKPTRLNLQKAGTPRVVRVNTPQVNTPGTDTFSLPEKKPAQGITKPAGLPEVLIAKDMSGKDQNPANFSCYNKQHGLKQDVIRCLLEDKSGNLWIGTMGGGVARYDGRSFTNFTDREGLADNFVISLLEDKKGNIWLGTSGGGVSCYDGRSFTNFTEKGGLSNNVVRCLLEDNKGNIWLGTNGGGLCRYDGSSFTIFTEKNGLAANSVTDLLEDKQGNIWISTDGGGVCRYNGKSFTTFTDREGLANNSVFSLLEDKSGSLWFGTDGGVSRYDGRDFMTFTEKEGLIHDLVVSLLEDKNGGIWMGTMGGGLCRYDGNSFTTFTEKEGLTDNFVRCLLEDRNGNIWLGTAGWGLCRYDGHTFTTFTEKEGLAGNAVWCLLEDKQGNIWLGTNGRGVSRYDGHAFTTFTEKEGLVNNVVYDLLEDKSGNIWLGTDGGVSRYDGKSFTNFTRQEGLAHSAVLSLMEDKNGNIWLGTDGGGVSRYDGHSFMNFTEKEGLANNVVGSLLEDKEGTIWLGTRFGLSRLGRYQLADLMDKARSNSFKEGDVFFKNYHYADGFLGIGCNRNALLQRKDGTIWIGANDRLTVHHPEGELTDTIAPGMQLNGLGLFHENIAWANLAGKKDTSLKLGNGVRVGNFEFDGLTRWYNLPEQLSLTYNNNYLAFHFIGITMAQPQKVKYQYKLEGNDANWSAMTNRTEAPYGNLAPGSYTFQVKAMNSSGYWSKELNYAFVIRPPWWKTWWFRTGAVLLIIFAVWYYITRRERKLKAEKERLEQTVKERTAEVVAQKHLVEEKHKEMIDSINYAERIQRSLLATKGLLDENLGEHFVFFQPKEVVSGDFYWADMLSNGNFVLVTADSTGHGVPGAIMSILNISCLKETIKAGILNPSEILNNTRRLIIDILKKDGTPEGGKDGMDCSLISFDFKNNRFTYSAANNPVWLIRDLPSGQVGKQILEFVPDKMPVSKHDFDQKPFTEHTIDLQKGDAIYTFTDGMADQFGGPKGKKFMYKQLKALLISIAPLPMPEQKQKLAAALHAWKGNLEQVDDVCIVGIRV